MISARSSTRLILALVIFVSLTAFAQDHPTVAAQQNTIYVGADGKFEAAPDTAQIQFKVSVQEDTAQTAFDRASKNVEQVRTVLRANGIDVKNATFGFLSVEPIYDWKNPRQKVMGYRVTSDVNLKLKDFSKVAAITQQLANANVSESQTLNYTLENIDEAKNKAVEDAYRRARSSAETPRTPPAAPWGRTLLRFRGYFRESAHSRARHGWRDDGAGECLSAGSHRRLYSTIGDGDGARKRAIQSEVDGSYSKNRWNLRRHRSQRIYFHRQPVHFSHNDELSDR